MGNLQPASIWLSDAQRAPVGPDQPLLLKAMAPRWANGKRALWLCQNALAVPVYQYWIKVDDVDAANLRYLTKSREEIEALDAARSADPAKRGKPAPMAKSHAFGYMEKKV